jgi:hypothetical protein
MNLNKNKNLIIIGGLAMVAYIFKDKIKTLLGK